MQLRAVERSLLLERSRNAGGAGGGGGGGTGRGVQWKLIDDLPGDILLVDDDPDLLKLISLRLTSAGYRVRTADSGETALAALAVAAPCRGDHRPADAGHRRARSCSTPSIASIRRCR